MDTDTNTAKYLNTELPIDTTDPATAKYSNIVGVFRDRANAEQAIEALKQAGMGEDNIQLTEYNPDGAEDGHDASLVASGTTEKGDDVSLLAPGTSERRILVHVRAEGREQEAVTLLIECGANNSDLPPGTALVEGSIVGANEDTAKTVTKHPTPGEPSESFFGTGKAPGHPGDASILDNPNPPPA